MSDDVSVEATGETVGEAKWAALRELDRLLPGLDKSTVRFEVISEGERGLLGVGYTPARVLAAAQGDPAAPPATAPAADESPEAAHVRELLERITSEIGARCSVQIAESDDELLAVCTGRELAVLIGHHGQTIDAIQYLLNAIVFRGQDERKPIVVDASGYRARRRAALQAIAQRSAERAAATGERVELEPMSAVERKVVHEYLKEDPEVETASEGTEPNRCVVIFPRRVV